MKTHFKVKLTGPYAGFSGLLFGRFAFENGVSVAKLHFLEAQLLASEARGLSMLDESGKEEGHVYPGAMPLAELEPGEMVVTLRDETENAEQIEVTVVTAIGEEQREVIDLSDIPDRAGLEAIADKEGMSGLRVIADRLGVRAKSIPVLIDKILEKRG
ncbi:MULTISPECIES: hypothetical protein [Aeromonas]|uniref:hypothetical protein n=1 Tax=Aeromonas TaxID=642 RepID=UPI001C241AB8|nr:hypothetical protein [Aeromonas sp. FDAARGOS 1417]QWZ66382.1 hypothetical protein I6L47_22290 [Aeromonas sp. FDAARGOS 1417]BEE07091.1 hypothetical protein VAWG002_42870 [Aeromonas veronii]